MANLSPSELASLLGPIDFSQVCQSPVARVPADDFAEWVRFTDEFARVLSFRLRPLVKAASRVQPNGRKSQTAESVIANHDARSVVGFWLSDRSAEPLSVILSPTLVTTFVDRLLGGRQGPSFDESIERRPLTEIDHRLAARLIDVARQCLIEATAVGASAASFELRELPTQTTSFEEAWFSDCSLLRLSFELRFVQGGGWLDLLIPHDVAAAFACTRSDDLSQKQGQGLDVSSSVGFQSRVLPKSQQTLVVAQLARTLLAVEDIQSLSVGDVLLTDVAPDEPLEVLVGESVWLRADSGCQDGHKAVRIQASGAAKKTARLNRRSGEVCLGITKDGRS